MPIENKSPISVEVKQQAWTEVMGLHRSKDNEDKPQSSVSATQTNRYLISLSLVVGAMLLLGVGYGVAAFSTSVSKENVAQSNPIAQSQFRHVAQFFSEQFNRSSWRYVSSEVNDNRVSVYIQIPRHLDLEKEYQQNYIVQSVCPRQENAIWQNIEPTQVTIHLFVQWKSKSVSSNCA